MLRVKNQEREQQMKTIIVDGKEYVEKSTQEEKTDKMKYVICRTQSAGVHAGYLKSREGQEVVLLRARRLWYWDGAASLSQAAVDGFSKPQNCKFPCEVSEILLLNAIEILPCTIKAESSIKGVSIWKA